MPWTKAASFERTFTPDKQACILRKFIDIWLTNGKFYVYLNLNFVQKWHFVHYFDRPLTKYTHPESRHSLKFWTQGWEISAKLLAANTSLYSLIVWVSPWKPDFFFFFNHCRLLILIWILWHSHNKSLSCFYFY